MVGYTGCEITPIDEAFQDALVNGSSLEETFEIIKDVRGIFWHQELGENSSLTHLTPGEGYMMYVNGDATTVSFSEEYCNDITYQLNSGWNMVAFTGDVNADIDIVSSMDNALATGEGIANTIQVIKNVSGQFWSNAFAQIQTFNPGEAYMMYVYSGQQTTLSFTENSTQVFENNPGVEFTLPVTDNNMSLVIPQGILNEYIGSSIFVSINGVRVSELTQINEDGAVGIPVIGTDYNYDLANSGDEFEVIILTNGDSVIINNFYPNTYTPNIYTILQYQGCTDENACNYEITSTFDNGSCLYFNDYAPGQCIRMGCLDFFASNYDSIANMNDGSCEYYNTVPINDSDFLLWLNDNYPQVISNDSLNIDTAALIEGHFNLYSTTIHNIDGIEYFTSLDGLDLYDNDSLTSLPDLSGLTNLSELYLQFNDGLECVGAYPEQLDIDFSFPLCIYGCTDESSLNYNSNADIDNGSCSNEELPVTDNNMSVVFPAGTLSDYVGGILQAYVAGTPVSEASPIGPDGAGGISVIGTNCANCNPPAPNSILADGGETVEFVIFMNGEAIVITDVNPPVVYAANSFEMLDGNTLTFTIDGDAVEFGCTDSAYMEYDASANLDDGSCATSIVNGCTDVLYTEYSESANTDNGSCATLVIEGCTDVSAYNYDLAANTDDGSCIYEFIYGCTDSEADNFDAAANVNCCCLYTGCMDAAADNYDVFANVAGACEYVGCMDASACNYDSGANVAGSCEGLVGCTDDSYYEFNASATCDDGSCASLIVPGCMDATALNYNPEASEDDGLCEYVILLTDAFWGADGELTYITANNMSVLIQAGTTNNLNSFNVLEAGDLLFAVYETSRLENEYLGYSKVSGMQMAGAAVWTGDQVEITIYGKDSQYDNGFEEGEEIVWLVEKADGVVYHVQILDAAGNDKTITWGNSEFAIVDGISVGAPFYDGCMNPTTPSYNPLAAQDDGSCTTPYSIGCMDENALNYAGVGANPTHDNAQNFGNLFGENRTYNLLTNQQSPSGIAANFSDDSYCQDQVEGCTDAMAINYDPQATQNDYTICDWTLNGMTEYNVDEHGIVGATDYSFGAWDYANNANDGIVGSDFDNANVLFWEGALNPDAHVIDNLANVMEWIDNNFQQISVDLAMGWNMIGYSCIHPISAEDALNDIVDEVLIMKDNNGSVYLPEWGFNGIGDLTPGHGYQLKVTNYILDFNICE